eukprot:6491917-Amphidinium_carterae.1
MANNEIQNYELETYDVENLYPTINIIHLTGVLRDKIQSHYGEEKGKPIASLLHLALRRQYVQHAGKLFHVYDGIPTGSPEAVICANIYMSEFDKTIATFVPFYKRFVDDILIVLEPGGNDDEWIQLIMNNWNDKIRVRRTAHSQTNVPFLDLQLSVTKTGFTYSLYSKPHNLYSYLPMTSAHPQHVYRAIIWSETCRHLRRHSSFAEAKESITKLALRLRDRGYDPKQIFETQRKAIRQFMTNRGKNKQPKRHCTTLVLCHSSNFSSSGYRKCIAKIRKILPVRVGLTVQKNTFRLLYKQWALLRGANTREGKG